MAHVIEGFAESEPDRTLGDESRKEKKSGGFQSFGLSFPVLKGVLTRGYKVPTPIQRKCIPLILSGHDVVAMARTGSGKTACFLLPMFDKLEKSVSKSTTGPKSLIFSPTRELALQTLKFIKELGKFTKLKAIAVLGGDSMDYQFGAVHENPDIIVATPGRFLHVCLEMELKLNSVQYVVFDEADRLFELGLGEQLQEILYRLPESRQTLLFSATLPKLLIDFARAGLSNPVLIRLDVETKLPKTLELAFLSVRSEEKTAALLCLLQALPKNKLTMVFTATKHHVDYLHAILDEAEISNTFLYSDLASAARKINVAKFQNGSCSVILVTDVAARGVDIPQLDYVINYHFPSKPKLFVHRVGRCARAGRLGTAFSLVSKSEVPYLLDLFMFLGRPLKVIPTCCGKKFEKEGNFGRVPENLLEAEHSRVLTWHEKNSDLDSMKKVCSNGYKKYLQSNSSASRESMKKGKKLNVTGMGIHHFFVGKDDEGEMSAANLLAKMKNYKPKGTIFELKSSASQRCCEIMKKTKRIHANYLNKNKEIISKGSDDDAGEGATPCSKKALKRKQDSNDSFDPRKKKIINEYYIPYSAPDHETENGLSVNTFLNDANKASFDIIADCEEELKLTNFKKHTRKWDKEKKKFVTVSGGQERSGKIRTESGKWVDASYKTGRYEKWKERSKIQNDDETDDFHVNNIKGKGMNVSKRHRGKHKQTMRQNLEGRSELRKPEQILKARKEMEKKRQKSIPKSKRKNFARASNGRRKN